MKTKEIERILPPVAPHMVGDGFRVHNFFPNGYRLGHRRMSPFFLLDYNSKVDFPPGNTPRGVGVHPHRGFETVTIAYHGEVSHYDSSGNSGIIKEGDVQWMTAGAGVLHKEHHSQEFTQRGGPFQMVQLWVNLPARDKMSKPKYQSVAHGEMGLYQIPENGGVIEVIAGELNGVKGPAHTFTPIEMYNARLKKNSQTTIRLPEHFNTGILVISGKVTVNAQTANADHFILFKNKGEQIEIDAEEESILLILSGEPIDEPVAAYGPFLMNTMEEVQQAIHDFQEGKFGRLDD